MHYSNYLSRLYAPLALFTVSLFTVLSLSRLMLAVIYRDRVSAVEGFLYVMVQGLRFDLIVACIFLLPVAVVHPFLNRFPVWSRCLRIYLLAAFMLAVFMEAATPTFIGEYDLRPNILFVEYLQYPGEVAAMLWGGYKLNIALGLGVVAILGGYFWRLLRRSVAPHENPGVVMCVMLVVMTILICAAGIRSSLGHRPVNPAKVAFSTDLLVNDLVLSSVYSTAYAIYSARRHERSVRAYGRMDFATVIKRVREEMAIPLPSFNNANLPTLHVQTPSSVPEKPLNLVIILQESLGAEFVGALGGVDVTPELDALAGEGIWFNNLYATGTRSVRGIEAVVSGFTPTPARSVVKLPKSQSGFFTIAELLGQRGYDTSFIYGGEAHFDNMRQFFVGNGFQRIIEEKDFDQPAFKGSWGVSDEDLFQRAHEEFSRLANKPFFSLVFTSSNHSPFEFPEGRIELYEQPRATVNNAVKYADHAMGEFFRKARASEYWDNTLFLVVADHNSRVRGADLVPIEYFHVPALILGGTIEHRTYDRIASQIDLLPTLLGMMGITSAHPATGHDLLRDDIGDIPGRAIMQYNQTQAYMQGDQVVIMELDKQPVMYRRTAAGLVKSAKQTPELIERALANSIWSSQAYQERLYRLPEKQTASSITIHQERKE
ncbi:LTA synthase family protein [Parahaliea aestuarii]|uniref:Sulfatase-like hydrolase/transferase n=1 Tax=Parahaliea aestuarii TaxID=1852021 RepID=A0A5C8ZUJ7_9GAMM|nr:LTA synthase family protein [Parahaliea aestuarii]TXS91489.1 sulfatase-like hydrolase/transferase [Parahaliea aestuarii]